MSFLISVAEAKAFMQITTTVTDTLIETYIDLTEAEVEAYLGRSLARATYTESLAYTGSYFDQSGVTLLDAGNRDYNLFLTNYPVLSLALSNEAAIPTETYSYNPANGVISNIYPNDPTATYVAGYTTVTAPNDLKGVVKLGVVSLFNNNGAASSGSGGTGQVASKRIKDFAVSYDNSQNSYTAQVYNGSPIKTYLATNSHILNKYRRITV